ncbi:GldG family protein [Solirubrobacter taibaiensis]|nr:GldG family protein [Solirubrobacter taibaiensis]
MALLHPNKTATLLFDEAHSQAWSIRPEVAQRMQPAHPADASYVQAAKLLEQRDFVVSAHTEGELTSVLADVLVIAHPSDPRWEATTETGSPRYSATEIEAIQRHVAQGGGLIVLGECDHDRYGNNLNELLEAFGIQIETATVQDYEQSDAAPTWIRPHLQSNGRGAGADVLARVNEVRFYRAGTLALSNGAKVIAHASPSATKPHAPLAVVTQYGEGRVVVLADSDLFSDDTIGEHDHADLWVNLVYWAAGPAFAHDETTVESPAFSDPAWPTLKAEIEALRALQNADGSIDLEGREAPEIDPILNAIEALRTYFPHQDAYLTALQSDLSAWAINGFAVPDFSLSLEQFRPDQHREDGIEHLVVFPMYKQNGPSEKVFEALIIRVPWPEWLAQLERTRFQNPKFVPVTFVDRTSGYESNTAVLFPETVSVGANKPANHFGAIFCDREAARLRAVATHAADVLSLNLAPDAAALLASPELSRQAFVLWDLIHDRAHSRGDLPFDPFMIRQRQPYWMYALEELRCDLTAFVEAVQLESEGFAFARYVQHAIVLDRLFRFPVTGPRVRNYDGLGGQLLFSYLHKHEYLHWTNNELTIEWDRLAEGVANLRAEVETLYREGIDSSKPQYWASAHDLVATYVRPAADSVWSKDRRELSDQGDPRRFIDQVQPDEFPLSLFYVSLQAKLAETVELAGVAA